MCNKLKLKRTEKKISIYKLAEKTGLSASYISNLENEHKKNPSKDTMDKIATALESTILEVFF